ncbi:MAG: hypothetical protein Q4F40_06980 [Akkermansia sp.]|nr:hypothetical protein [Akkermansia sp.]
MKLRNILAVGLAALAGMSYAQEPAKQQGLVAVVQVSDKSKPTKLMVKGASGKDTFVYYDRGSEADVQRSAAKMKVFFLLTPEDMVAAEHALNAGELEDARAKLGAVKAKYKGFLGLDRNPAERAAVLEIDCAVRQLDFAGLKSLLGSFPHPDWLSAEDKGKYMAAQILAKACTGTPLAEIEASAKELLDSGVGKTLNGDCYGWVRYALAYATAAAIPAEELAGTISEGNLAAANKAIDLYCQAGASSHGRDMELPVDAMSRAQALLWAMPGVKEYAAKGKDMDSRKWNDAPYNFRDAVALAYILKNVFGATGETIEAAAPLYFNTQAGKE